MHPLRIACVDGSTCGWVAEGVGFGCVVGASLDKPPQGLHASPARASTLMSVHASRVRARNQKQRVAGPEKRKVGAGGVCEENGRIHAREKHIKRLALSAVLLRNTVEPVHNVGLQRRHILSRVFNLIHCCDQVVCDV